MFTIYAFRNLSCVLRKQDISTWHVINHKPTKLNQIDKEPIFQKITDLKEIQKLFVGLIQCKNLQDLDFSSACHSGSKWEIYIQYIFVKTSQSTTQQGHCKLQGYPFSTLQLL